MIERPQVKLKDGSKLVHYENNGWEIMSKVGKGGSETVFFAECIDEESAGERPSPIVDVEHKDEYIAMLRFQSFEEPIYI